MPTLTIPAHDHCAGQSDAMLLARRDCNCGAGELYERTHGGDHCAACERCGQPGHACAYPGPLAYHGSWCDYHYLLEVRYRFMLQLRRG